jgi:hypothetical protein
MTDHSEHSPLEEFKEKVNEVLELLNQSNLPVVVPEGVDLDPLDTTAPSETPEVTHKSSTGE